MDGFSALSHFVEEGGKKCVALINRLLRIEPKELEIEWTYSCYLWLSRVFLSAEPRIRSSWSSVHCSSSKWLRSLQPPSGQGVRGGHGRKHTHSQTQTCDESGWVTEKRKHSWGYSETNQWVGRVAATVSFLTCSSPTRSIFNGGVIPRYSGRHHLLLYEVQ